VKSYIVFCGKYMGRVLARSLEDARKWAEVYWGRGRAYKIRPVEKKLAEKTP